MPLVDATTLNLWKSYTYFDPEIVLGDLRRIQLEVDLGSLPPKIANLRTNDLKEARERRDAALFTLGMGRRLGTKMVFAPVEDSDYDFVVAWVADETLKYCPVQLKELVPDELNPSATLAALFGKIKLSYPTSSETVVAIHVNKVGTLDVRTLEVPSLPVGEVFLFGAISPDQTEWVLIGDLLGELEQSYFEHPPPTGHAA